MEAYCWYLLKVSVCLLVFYAFYVIALRRSTYFMLNRLYLVFGLLLSFVIPVLKLSIFESHSKYAISRFWDTALIESEYNYLPAHPLSVSASSIDLTMILSVVYFAGITFLFFKLLFSIFSIINTCRSAEKSHLGRIRVVKTNAALPFSFFNLIFMPKNEDNPLIFEHETAHVRQFHWLDLLLVELSAVLLWFNPVLVLYKSALKLQHEYLADSYVVKDERHMANYLACMLRQIQVVSLDGLVSHFYCKTFKKRIVMITKNRTSVKFLALYFLAIPLVCMLLFAFTGKFKDAPVSGLKEMVNAENIPSIYPIEAKSITKVNGYGERINPVSKKKDFHYGVDFAALEGLKVMATARGVIVEAAFDKEKKKGNYVVIKHNEEYFTFYSHLKSISVNVGDKVEKGQLIGYVGNTGISTGPHLHYEVIHNGQRENPEEYLPKK